MKRKGIRGIGRAILIVILIAGFQTAPADEIKILFKCPQAESGSMWTKFVAGKLHPKVIPQNFAYISGQYAGVEIKINIHSEIRLDSDEILRYPFLIFYSTHGVKLTKSEIKMLGRYLKGGGFLILDEPKGSDEKFIPSMKEILKRALGKKYKVKLIPEDHPIYKVPFKLKGPPWGVLKPSKVNALEGIFIGERLAVLISDRGYCEWWAYAFPPPRYEDSVFRFGANLISYALKGR